MRITLLSDAHIVRANDPTQSALVALIDHWETDEWVLAGDIFDFWWDWGPVIYAAAVPLLGALWRQRQKGVKVTWLGGNHDFCIGPVIQEELGIAVDSQWKGELPSGRVLVFHGDQADRSLSHRIFRRMTESSVFRWGIGWLGPRMLWRLARRASEASRLRHSPKGLEALVKSQEALGDALLSEGGGVVCMGHSHTPGISRREHGLLVNLGDFMVSRTFVCVEDSVCLYTWENGAASLVAEEALRPDG